MHEPKASALRNREHYATESVIASSEWTTLKPAKRVLNVLLLVESGLGLSGS